MDVDGGDLVVLNPANGQMLQHHLTPGEVRSKGTSALCVFGMCSWVEWDDSSGVIISSGFNLNSVLLLVGLI
jgi:hypothetical protein